MWLAPPAVEAASFGEGSTAIGMAYTLLLPCCWGTHSGCWNVHGGLLAADGIKTADGCQWCWGQQHCGGVARQVVPRGKGTRNKGVLRYTNMLDYQMCLLTPGMSPSLARVLNMILLIL